ncbi:uncharacterized protein UDID_18186 [Ustilago sp. UG-2017a]|nr:uncharacterized protein UDID_18186 [Ustilago sp. UG-2017a]
METALRPCSLLVPSCFPSIPAHDRSTRPLMMRRHGYIPLHSVASNTAPALSPESTLFVEYCTGGPSSTTPVLLSCVGSFDTAPPPCYPACLAPLCLLSCVDSFDTAPPPQDLLAGFLYTAPSL